MTIRHLNIFLAVCGNGCNTTRAAEALHMTQPAVSLAIRELEQYYGVRLFDRIGRRLFVTEAGRNMEKYASGIASAFADMERDMHDWDGRGVLRVGASITIGSQFLPGYVKAFRRCEPGIQVRALVAPSDELEQRIIKNELDFAMIEGVAHSPQIVSEEYMEDRLAVICPVSGSFAAGSTISVEEFSRQDFLLREPGSGTREVFDRVAESAGFRVAPIWEAMSTTALVNAVISGLGVAVLPYRMVIGPVQRGLVNFIRVEGLDFSRRFNIIHHEQKQLTRAAQAFMELCRHYEDNYPLPEYNVLV